MPSYYNPYQYMQNAYPSYGVQQPYAQMAPVYNTANAASNYMTSVDGEMAARAWQPPAPLPPNTIVPLWDYDGQHVYFKSTDAYGRMNPIRKGRVVFDDEIAEKEEVSGKPLPAAKEQDMSGYVTKEDFDDLRHEIRGMFRNMNAPQPVNNQNGRKPSGGDNR